MPHIDELDPSAIFKDESASVLIRGSGFWNTDTLTCRLRVNDATTSLLTTTFINSTTIQCEFPASSDTVSKYEIGVTLNGYEFTDLDKELELSVNDPITIFSVFPVVMFKNQKNVEILVRADPLISSFTYFCVVHEFFIEGEIYTENNIDYVKCEIPSYDAIVNSASTPLPHNDEVNVTLASGGVIFSTGGVTFKFLDQDQVNGISPLNGPDTGGTVIVIELDIDQTVGDIGDVYCLFYNTTSVLAVASPPFDFLCTTPALNYDV
jgi:hypothetical protein